ncbi:MAG TPA: hypothetical protein VGU23_03915, partial [Acidobacteriaceae bacterium]|nr:hypothetical protein [Acidobacteriaceae bacterium]
MTAVFSARRAFDRASQSAAADSELPFTLRTLDTSNAAQIPGAEMVAPHRNYTTGALFFGDLYLGGPSGLTILRADGTSRVNLRSGLELPVASIHAMTVGRVRGTKEPQLLLATAGAGLLVV